jgi:type I restriction enzyme S subunit
LYQVKSGYAFEGALLGDIGFPVIKIANIQSEFVDLDNCDRYAVNLSQRIARFELVDGDLVIAMTGAQMGKVGMVAGLQEKSLLN